MARCVLCGRRVNPATAMWIEIFLPDDPWPCRSGYLCAACRRRKGVKSRG